MKLKLGAEHYEFVRQSCKFTTVIQGELSARGYIPNNLYFIPMVTLLNGVITVYPNLEVSVNHVLNSRKIMDVEYPKEVTIASIVYKNYTTSITKYIRSVCKKDIPDHKVKEVADYLMASDFTIHVTRNRNEIREVYMDKAVSSCMVYKHRDYHTKFNDVLIAKKKWYSDFYSYMPGTKLIYVRDAKKKLRARRIIFTDKGKVIGGNRLYFNSVSAADKILDYCKIKTYETFGHVPTQNFSVPAVKDKLRGVSLLVPSFDHDDFYNLKITLDEEKLVWNVGQKGKFCLGNVSGPGIFTYSYYMGE